MNDIPISQSISILLITLSGFVVLRTEAQIDAEMNAAYFTVIRGINLDTFGTTGVYGKGDIGVFGQTETRYGSGVYGNSTRQNANGVYGTATGGGYGVYGRAFGTTGGGVLGRTSATFNHGVIGITDGTFGAGVYAQGQTYGAECKGLGSNGTGVNAYGVYIGVSSGAGQNGYDFYATGFNNVDYGSTSSRRWKREIRNIDRPLEKIGKLRGVYFTWDDDHGGNHDIGFIAEEVGEIIPEIVGYEKNGIDAIAMDYGKMTPLLLESINAMRNEYQEEIRNLQEKARTLEEELKKIQATLAEVHRTINP
ncbi:MAG: tail fiber domain-containing protein [Saprospiraceae bacterium]|nr:tail fiber domain-containing protein [Saprospiraceae bacterium]